MDDISHDVKASIDAQIDAGNDADAMENPISTCIEVPPMHPLCEALAVNLSATPVPGNIPNNVNGAKYACWNFTAGENGAEVNSAEFQRVGPGNGNSFEAVYLFDGSQRITGPHKIDGANTVHFSQLELFIPKLSTKTVCAVASANPSGASGVHTFELSSAQGLSTNSCHVEGNFPLRGADQLLSSGSVGNITIQKNGILEAIQAGTNNAVIAKISLATDQKEDQLLSRLALIIRMPQGVCELKNFKLWIEGGKEPFATTAKVDSHNLLTFVPDQKPYSISQGQTINAYVTVDIPATFKGQTIQMYLEEKVDLLSLGSNFGFGAQVDHGKYDGTDEDALPGNENDHFSYVVIQ
jgi:hypothetical protein